jgi:bla regulator protein blaR1
MTPPDDKLGRMFRLSTLAIALALSVPLTVSQEQTPPRSPFSTVAQAPITTEPQWQIAAGGKRSFDIVSIHPTKPGEFTPPTFPLDSGNIWFSGKDAGAGLLVSDFPVWVYIAFAYKLSIPASERKAMLAHLPSWVENENFEIRARAPGNASKDQVRLMMQSMLVDRFKLAIHFETHEGPVLALTLIHPGKLGDKLRPHADGPPCNVPPLREPRVQRPRDRT